MEADSGLPAEEEKDAKIATGASRRVLEKNPAIYTHAKKDELDCISNGVAEGAEQ